MQAPRAEEIFLKTFGDLEKLKDLDIVIKYYKKRNWKIPAGKLMHISKIHANIQSFDHILFLLESWLYVKKFPTVPSEWQLKNYNGDGNNYFLKSLLNGKEHDIMGMLKKSDTEISKMIFSKLFNLGEKELNRRKLERYENIHRFHFGWRKQLYLDDLKNNEFPL